MDFVFSLLVGLGATALVFAYWRYREWRVVKSTGVWSYEENVRTGKRRIVRIGGGHQPRDLSWVQTGVFTDWSTMTPPTGGGAGRKP